MKLLIFPEGTRNKSALDSGLRPFKKGAFRIAIENQLPVLPIVYSPYYFIDEKTHFFGHGKYNILRYCKKYLKKLIKFHNHYRD